MKCIPDIVLYNVELLKLFVSFLWLGLIVP